MDALFERLYILRTELTHALKAGGGGPGEYLTATFRGIRETAKAGKGLEVRLLRVRMRSNLAPSPSLRKIVPCQDPDLKFLPRIFSKKEP